MARKAVLTTEMISEVIRLYVEESKSIVAINKITKAPLNRIKGILVENNIEIRKSKTYSHLSSRNIIKKTPEENRARKMAWYEKNRKSKRITQISQAVDRCDEIIQMYVNNEFSITKISSIIGLSPHTINKLLKNTGASKRDSEFRKRARREKTEKWAGETEIINKYWRQIQKNAKRRGWEFNLTKTEAIEIMHSQNYLCALSGVEIQLPRDPMMYHGSYTASIDRIDSSKGYSKENCQWLHKRINVMKLDDNDKDFYEWSKKIYLNLKERFEGENG